MHRCMWTFDKSRKLRVEESRVGYSAFLRIGSPPRLRRGLGGGGYESPSVCHVRPSGPSSACNRPLTRPAPAGESAGSGTPSPQGRWQRLNSLCCLLLTAFCLLPSAYCPAAGWLYKVQEVKPNVFVWVADDVLDLEGDPQFDRAGRRDSSSPRRA